MTRSARDIHRVAVTAKLVPRFVYTNDAADTIGVDLLVAGDPYLTNMQASDLISVCYEHIAATRDWRQVEWPTSFRGHDYRARLVDSTWKEALSLTLRGESAGAVVQIHSNAPTNAPCALPYPPAHSCWRYLESDASWDLDVPAPSYVALDWDLIEGAQACSAARWDPDYWEIFSKRTDEIDRDRTSILPFSCLIDLGWNMTELSAMPPKTPGE